MMLTLSGIAAPRNMAKKRNTDIRTAEAVLMTSLTELQCVAEGLRVHRNIHDTHHWAISDMMMRGKMLPAEIANLIADHSTGLQSGEKTKKVFLPLTKPENAPRQDEKGYWWPPKNPKFVPLIHQDLYQNKNGDWW